MVEWTQFDTVFVVGNGESRKGFDLSILRRYGIIWGCNALYRDFVPDVLVSLDANMTEEIRQSGYTHSWIHKIDPEWLQDRDSGQRFRFRRMHPVGIMSVIIAAQKHPYAKIICLLGFDLGLVSRQQGVINTYKGTRNYEKSHTMHVLAPRWSAYLRTVFEEFPEIQFVRVGPTDDMVPEWQNLSSDNLWFLSYSEFENEWLANTNFVE